MAASVHSMQAPAVGIRPRDSAAIPSGRRQAIPQCRSHSTVSCRSKRNESDAQTRFCCDEVPSGTKRRGMLFQILFSALSFPSIVECASAETGDLRGDFRTYEDETNKYRLLVPQGWLKGTGEGDSVKLVTAFYPEEASDSNVSILITGVGPDFTRLESFGSVDAFAETLVSGLDRSWKRPPGVAAKLMNSKAANGLYYIEYTLQNPGERCRHILTALGMASNGWYNRLYTVTGQFIEDDTEKFRSQIEKSVSSFRLF